MDEFTIDKIASAIYQAFHATQVHYHFDQAKEIAKEVEQKLIEQETEIPTVERVQDVVEETLIEKGLAKTAKAYIYIVIKEILKEKKRI